MRHGRCADKQRLLQLCKLNLVSCGSKLLNEAEMKFEQQQRSIKTSWTDLLLTWELVSWHSVQFHVQIALLAPFEFKNNVLWFKWQNVLAIGGSCRINNSCGLTLWVPSLLTTMLAERIKEFSWSEECELTCLAKKTLMRHSAEWEKNHMSWVPLCLNETHTGWAPNQKVSCAAGGYHIGLKMSGMAHTSSGACPFTPPKRSQKKTKRMWTACLIK